MLNEKYYLIENAPFIQQPAYVKQNWILLNRHKFLLLLKKYKATFSILVSTNNTSQMFYQGRYGKSTELKIYGFNHLSDLKVSKIHYVNVSGYYLPDIYQYDYHLNLNSVAIIDRNMINALFSVSDINFSKNNEQSALPAKTGSMTYLDLLLKSERLTNVSVNHDLAMNIADFIISNKIVRRYDRRYFKAHTTSEFYGSGKLQSAAWRANKKYKLAAKENQTVCVPNTNLISEQKYYYNLNNIDKFKTDFKSDELVYDTDYGYTSDKFKTELDSVEDYEVYDYEADAADDDLTDLTFSKEYAVPFTHRNRHVDLMDHSWEIEFTSRRSTGWKDHKARRQWMHNQLNLNSAKLSNNYSGYIKKKAELISERRKKQKQEKLQRKRLNNNTTAY